MARGWAKYLVVNNKNIKNPVYNNVGIGVWRYGSRTRLVTDFYKP